MFILITSGTGGVEKRSEGGRVGGRVEKKERTSRRIGLNDPFALVH